MDLTGFAEEVGSSGEVGALGLGTRGGCRAGVRCVSPPSGIDWFQPDEMTVSCAAGTPVEVLFAALAEHGQGVALPAGGTVGGALSVGHSAPSRLGRGPIRDTVLQARFVSAAGEVVTAGGPTVKNVTGFDLCRLLVGARGSLGLVGDVILRTRPLPASSGWFAGAANPFVVLRRLYRPAAVLWDGTTTWVCLEGDPRDVADQAAVCGLPAVDGPPDLPTGGRWALRPAELPSLPALGGRFVAEVGVGIVHHESPPPVGPVDAAVREVERRIKHELDPDGRFGPTPGA